MPDDKKVHKASAAALAHIDELLDEALKQTFPASDPVAINIERASDERRERKSPLKPVASHGGTYRASRNRAFSI
jgi:hypothetical protein